MQTAPDAGGPDRDEVALWRGRIEGELDRRVLPFWMRHSLDQGNGGYWNCLDRDGSVFDTTKHVWLQGRQVWMLSRLFIERRDPALLAAARLGAEFLSRHAVGEDGRAYFSVAETGEPVSLQRKIFSECFLVMAFAEFARASGEDAYRARALALFDRVLLLIAEPARLGRPMLTGAPPASELAVPMILLNLVAELRGDPGSATFGDRADYDAIERTAVEGVLRHADPTSGELRESVAPDGSHLAGSKGRLLNPGHAIEAGWFLVVHARRVGDAALLAAGLKIIERALDIGWDREHGGLFYFLDAQGFSPVQLEWSQKLWWPHCEAMVGTLVSWRATGDPDWWRRFVQVADWTWAHFPDAEHGEWFGYLDRQGRVSQRFKGGPYKGFFHVPRALWMCQSLL